VRIAAVCAIYGGYDLVPPVPPGFDDAVLVTDRPVVSDWRNVVVPSGEHPRLAAKLPRCRPDRFTDADASMWMDGTLHVRDERLAATVRRLLDEHDLVLWRHPEDRDDLYQEAAHCRDWPKYRDEPLDAQVAAYRAEGVPEHGGLWATGTIARRHTAAMASLGDAWLEEMRRWTIQDQVSLPAVLWRRGVRPAAFPFDQYDNDLVDWVPHAADLRAQREHILDLERTIIHLEGEALHLRTQHAALERTLGRRSVRLALRLTGSIAPLARALRRSRAAGPGPRRDGG
jgi:hypothetical protein